jgi:hypothetical protein
VRTPNDFENAFKAAAKKHSQALLTTAKSLTVIHLKKIADLALKGRLPMMVAERGLLELGGLMSYGPITLTCTGVLLSMSIRSLRALNRRICRSNKRPSSS